MCTLYLTQLLKICDNYRKLLIKLKIALESKHAHHINIDNRSFKVYRIIFS